MDTKHAKNYSVSKTQCILESITYDPRPKTVPVPLISQHVLKDICAKQSSALGGLAVIYQSSFNTS